MVDPTHFMYKVSTHNYRFTHTDTHTRMYMRAGTHTPCGLHTTIYVDFTDATYIGSHMYRIHAHMIYL